MTYMYEVHIFLLILTIMFGFLYILKFANTNLSAVFSRQCEERNLVDMDTVVFKFTFFVKTVIVYLCFMHKYM